MNDADEIARWQQSNTWFNSNPALQQAAIGIEGHLAAQGVPLAERLAHTTRTLQRGLGGPHDEQARNTYREMARVDAKFGQKITEDDYVAATYVR